MSDVSVGIIGLGAYLPSEVRRNDWWPAATVATWPKRLSALLAHTEADPGFPVTEGARRMMVALREEGAKDPFFGVHERRLMPPGMLPHEMEIQAARAALENSGVPAADIGAVFVHSMVPSLLTLNQAAPVHQALGLSRQCLCSGVDAVCNSFVTQLTIASDMIRAGRIKYALLVQSSAVSRIADYDDWSSQTLGDGSTSLVLGPVGAEKGLRGLAYRTDSRNYMGIVTGNSDRPWWEECRTQAFVGDKQAARRTLFETPDIAQEVLAQALTQANVAPEEVNFYACHQAIGNLRKVTQEMAGLKNARYLDIMRWAGNLSSASIPLQLVSGVKDQMIRDGDVVAMMSLGAGSTVAAAVLRWGA